MVGENSARPEVKKVRNLKVRKQPELERLRGIYNFPIIMDAVTADAECGNKYVAQAVSSNIAALCADPYVCRGTYICTYMYIHTIAPCLSSIKDPHQRTM